MNGLCGQRNNKIENPYFQTLLKGHDIILLTETWTSDVSNINVEGYCCYPAHRTLRKKKARRDSGGLIVYIKDDISSGVEFIRNVNDDLMWLKLDKHFFCIERDIMLCLCYVVPQNSTRQSVINFDIFDRIQTDIAEFESESINWYMITGDFNARTANNADFVEDDNASDHLPFPDNYSVDVAIARSSEDRSVNEYGRRLLELCISTGLRIVNGRLGQDQGHGKFTCVTSRGSSVVDYVLSSVELFTHLADFTVLDPTPFSDHNKVVCTLNVSTSPVEQERSVYGLEAYVCQKDKKYVWDNSKNVDYLGTINSEDIKQEFNTVINDLGNAVDGSAIDKCVGKFTDILAKVADPLFARYNCTSQCTHSRYKAQAKVPEWMCDNCHTLRDVFYSCLNDYRVLKTDDKRKSMTGARNNYVSHTRACRLRYAKTRTNELLKSRFNNARDYWKLLKGSQSYSRTNVTKEQFHKYFENISSQSGDFFNADIDTVEYVENMVRDELHCMFEELDCHITIEEIERSIKQLKSGKSAGPDVVINELFIHGSKEISVYLELIFNKLLESGNFPKQWSDGLIVPIHKKGSIHAVENYRGITLLSAFGKLFTRVLNNRLTHWAEEYGVYVEAQGGFRSGYSTTDSIFALHNLIKWSLNNKKKLYCVFVDYRKAFDYVVRDNLWYKLLKVGVTGKMFNIIRDMYKTVSSRVKGLCSGDLKSFQCILGVRQGESLSPFLFAMYINDLEKTMSDSGARGLTIDTLKLFVLFYADDAVIFSDTRAGLQQGLDVLYEYCQHWKLELNTDKTKVVVFRAGGRLSRLDSWSYNDTPLDIVNCFTYLGINLFYTGSFAKTQLTLAKQGRKAIFSLKKMVKQFSGLDPLVLCDLFDKMVLPILTYGCEVWGFHPSDAIERVHRDYMRSVLKVRTTTLNEFLYGELGRLPLRCIRHVRIVKYWFKILQSPDRRLISSLYLIQKSHMESHENIVNWASLLRDMLCSYGFGDVWLNQGVGDIDNFMIVFKQRVKDVYNQTWHAKLEESRKAITYRNFMHCIKPQVYLTSVHNVKYRSALIKFRLRNTHLRVETGSWNGPTAVAYHLRTCQFCNKNQLEDEYHFVMSCPLYSEIRRSYIPKFYRTNQSMYKFINLMSTENTKILNRLATFVYKAFEKRQSVTIV